MIKMRKLPMVLGLGFAADKARATVISYESDSIIELDLYQKWLETGGNPIPGYFPSRAAGAALYIEIQQLLQPNTTYSNAPGSLGETPISVDGLSVATNERAYEIFDDPWTSGGLLILLETDNSASISNLDLRLGYDSAPDSLRLEGTLTSSTVDWRYEYFDPDLNDGFGGVTGTGFSGSFETERVSVGPTAIPIVTPVPLPAGLLLLGSGVILFGFGAKMRNNRDNQTAFCV